MSKVVQRLLTFFIGIPLVLGIVFFDPSRYHYILNFLTCIFSALAASELYSLFSTKTKLPNKVLVTVLSFIQPVSAFLLVVFGKDHSFINYENWIFLVSAMIIMASEVFSHKTFEESNTRLSGAVFIVFYTGYLFTFIPRLALLSHSTLIICIFLFSVFINDSLAWFFGILFGKNNRGVFAASPNKSVIGFLGGYAGTIATCVAVHYIWPDLFQGSPLKGAVMGFFCATAGIIGDLIESVFKRSAVIKDSGNIIPGRGGVLDSVDSLLFTSPVFYILLTLLYHPEFIR